MDSLSNLLEPHQDTIGALASGAAYLNQISGLIVCYSIFKQKSTVGHSILPFVIVLTISALICRFGTILNDATLIQVNLVKTVMCLGQVYFFFHYTKNVEDRRSAWTQVLCFGALLTVVFTYSLLEDQKVLKFRFGMIFTVLMFCLMSLPLLRLPTIVRTKSSAGLPFPMISTGALITFLWFLYAIATRETFSMVQNGVFCLLCLFQVVLCFKYPVVPGKPEKSTEKKKNIKKLN